MKKEIKSVIFFFLGILILVSLLKNGRDVGKFGEFTWNILFSFLGYISYLIPVLLIYFGFKAVFKSVKESIEKEITGFFLLLISVSLIFNLFFSHKIPEISGSFGSFLRYIFVYAFGKIGSYIFGVALLIVGIIFTFEISIMKIKEAVVNEVKDIKDVIIHKKEKVIKDLKEKKEKKKKEKKRLEKIKEEPIKRKEDRKEDKKEKIELKEYQLPGDFFESKYKAKKEPDVESRKKVLEKTFENFRINARIADVSVGPAVICYEIELAPGVKISQISSIERDIALSLGAQRVRIISPLPGKARLGIEIPRHSGEIVHISEIINSPEFKSTDVSLPIALGKKVTGEIVVEDLAGMPHLLIAGATGSGKSVCIHSIIVSLLYKLKPDELKFLMIDPKVVELPVYNGIGHLLCPVVTSVRDSIGSLRWVVREMEERLKLFGENEVRDIGEYNTKFKDKVPYIVVIIDELADLMSMSQQKVETIITRLAQMSRAAGIHLVLSTQRPSVNVITGVIKANLPARVAFQVISKVDSRTILDSQGAESLLGRGDMLYLAPGSPKPERIQGSFITLDEVKKIVSFIKKQSENIVSNIEIKEEDKKISVESGSGKGIKDELFLPAVEFVLSAQKASTSLLQRKFSIGYQRAANLIDALYEAGIIGEELGPTKGRKVLKDISSLEDIKKKYASS